MKFLIDECLHTSLAAIAHEHGHEGFHVVYLGMQGFKDHEVVKRAAERDYTLVTNNAVDFRRLYRHLPLHAGLLILIPNVTPKQQRELFRAAVEELGADEWINSVVEVDLEGDQISVTRYSV